jgi:hypothetical protein
MGLPFLSPEWCAAARSLMQGSLPAREGLNCQIHYEVVGPDGSLLWSQGIVDGQVVHWDLGGVAEPDVTVRWALVDALGVMRSTITGTEAMQRATVLNDRASSPYEGPPPPMDLASPELGDLPRLPGATVAVQFEFRSAPFGPTSWSIAFEDGQVVGLAFGRRADADVSIELPYRAVMEVHAGLIGPIDAVAQGRISGDETGMILFGGMLETPAYQRAQRQCRGGGLALAVLGEVSAGPEWRTAMAELAAQTVDPR